MVCHACVHRAGDCSECLGESTPVTSDGVYGPSTLRSPLSSSFRNLYVHRVRFPKKKDPWALYCELGIFPNSSGLQVEFDDKYLK